MWGRYLCTCETESCHNHFVVGKIDENLSGQKAVDDQLTFFKCQPAIIFDTHMAYTDFMCLYGFLVKSGEEDYSEFAYFMLVNSFTRKQIMAFMNDLFEMLKAFVKVDLGGFPVEVDFVHLRSESNVS